jgi:hypothetical protein
VFPLERLPLGHVADDHHHPAGRLALDPELDIDAATVLAQKRRLDPASSGLVREKAAREELAERFPLFRHHQLEHARERVDLVARASQDFTERVVHRRRPLVLDDGEPLAEVAEGRKDALVHRVVTADGVVEPGLGDERRHPVDRGAEDELIVVGEFERARRAHQGDADDLRPEVEGDAVDRARAAPLDDVGGDRGVALRVADCLRALRFPDSTGEALPARERGCDPGLQRVPRRRLHVQPAVLDDEDAGGVDRRRRLQQGAQRPGQEGLDLPDPECRGRDAVEGLERPLPGLAVALDRGGDRLIDRPVQDR